MHFLIALVPILLTALGGQTAATLLTVPATALLSVHSLAAAGTIVEGMSLAQKLEAVNLLISAARNARNAHQRLQPLHEAILAKLQADIAKARADVMLRHDRLYSGEVVAHHVGGPLGFGRTPIIFVYDPEAGHVPHRVHPNLRRHLRS